MLAAAAGIYAFRQVGERLELIDARVPQAVSSMEISRAADRLIASAPALLAAVTTKELDEVSNRMRPEVDRLIIGLNEVGRVGTAGEAAIAIQLLVASLRSNLAELENLVGQRLKTRERLAGLLQAVFQTNQEAQRLFAPWFQVMDMQINRSLEDARKRDAEAEAQAARGLVGIDRSRPARRRPHNVDSPPPSTSWFRPRLSAKSRAFRWSHSSCAGASMISTRRRKSSTPNCAPCSSIR